MRVTHQIMWCSDKFFLGKTANCDERAVDEGDTAARIRAGDEGLIGRKFDFVGRDWLVYAHGSHPLILFAGRDPIPTGGGEDRRCRCSPREMNCELKTLCFSCGLIVLTIEVCFGQTVCMAKKVSPHNGSARAGQAN
jgi:hypothetical protein